MRQMRVHLVADPMLTDALAERVRREVDLVVSGRNDLADDDLPESVARARPQVVVVDVSGREWGPTLRRLGAAVPHANLVVVATQGDAEGAVDASRARAAAWFPRGCSADRLVAVLRTVDRGHAHYPPEHLGEVLRRMWEDLDAAREPSGAIARLTDRERVVLGYLTDGWRSREIAEDLDITVNTVRAHTSRILRKLGVHSRLEAIRVARTEGFVADP